MVKGCYVMEYETGDVYIVYDSTDEEICILQFFDYAQFPNRRQLAIWRPKEKFMLFEMK